MIHVSHDQLTIRFDRFGLTEYGLFLRTKKLPEAVIDYDVEADSYTVTAPARFASLLGVDQPLVTASELPLADHLFDYQKFIVMTALSARRYAIWADCGLGKTAMFLEFARHVIHRTAGRVLILSPLAIIQQTIEECLRWYGDALHITPITTRDDLVRWCTGIGTGVGICNYEKLIPGVLNEVRHLSGLILDESSILKSGGGKIKWNLIKSARGIEYKLSCTATPAPNDPMEYASQAAFLEKLRTEADILWTFFQRDKRGVWRVKPHAQTAFFEFMCGWSIYLRRPAVYGWRDNLREVPEPDIRFTEIPISQAQARAASALLTQRTGRLIASDRLGVTERTKLLQIAKGFMYRGKSSERIESEKPDWIAQCIREELADGRQVLVWTIFDEESALIVERLDIPSRSYTCEILDGRVKRSDRQPIIERFRHGQTDVLISKASLLGYGMNFQHCTSMIFSGWNDSYEQFYQAIRRAYRYGQTQRLRVHVPYIPDLEGIVLDNLRRKQGQFETDTAIQEQNYLMAMEHIIQIQQEV